MSLATGSHLGPYEILGLVGAGGMGEVYRARDPRLGREVAVKVLPSEVPSDSARLALFEREARAVAALNHPNILTVHDVGTHDGTPYVVTELLEGETLRELVSRRVPTTQQILSYMLQAARGLEAAHAKGIVHRDLKPENLYLTTDGRVKVLDFGLAKLVRSEAEITSEISTAAQSTPPGQVAGTVFYMSPEQARAQAIDVRSDIFSFGVVLHELLARKHPFRKDTVAGTLTAIVEETPPNLESLSRAIPPSIGGIVRRCLEKAKEDRYASGHDVVMVLEAVLAAPSGAAALQEVEERSPYPGLSSFTEKDAAVFFGRENEVEELWRRTRNRRLLAVIGPSGVGKTSFVRAGVVAGRPEGWAALVCAPGQGPMRSLARALAPELVGDPEALTALPDFEDVDVAVSLLTRWRRLHGEVLLVVDQFEELFTLNPLEVQEHFAGLLGRLASEADIHVLLSLRDDFLMRCHDQAPLAGVFTELTPLGSLSREDLRRALIEPARKLGYGFENEALIEEMLDAVEGARAALPLLAFAVSHLWEKRDREKKVLTRAAYEEIGGVAGALAQHAEQTLDRIGSERHGTVREIFRNLVTSHGTRAVADREELLSVSPDREAAEEVLGQLVDARLLTSYEVDDPDRHSERAVVEDRAKNLSVGASSPHRIEIVHESLLKAWPRLVRWQTQDEEGAFLRDQLKQAAHLWDERGRSPDVLWSGMALREYELWRERYAGRLTDLEESFAGEMLERDRRRKRLRRSVVVVAFAVLAAVAASIAVSRQQVATSRDEAQAAALRAEASKLLALAQLRLDDDPTEALAFVTSSLELADSEEARLLAVRALWEAPPAIEIGGSGVEIRTPSFSPDGKRLAGAGHTREAKIWTEEGGDPITLPGHEFTPRGPNAARWTSGGLLVTGHPGLGRFIHVWSAEGDRLRTIEFEGPSWWQLGTERLLVETREVRPDGTFETLRLRSWRLPDGEAEELGRVDWSVLRADWSAFDPSGFGWLYGKERDVYYRPLPISGETGDRLFSRHPSSVLAGEFPNRSDRRWLVDESKIQLWSFTSEGLSSVEVIPRPMTASGQLSPAPSGRWLTNNPARDGQARLWNRGLLPGARPLTLLRSGSWYLAGFSFHPRDDWYVASTAECQRLTLWPLHQPLPSVVDGYTPIRRPLAFSADSRWLATSWADLALRLWPLPPSDEGAPRKLSLPEATLWTELAVDPAGRFIFVSGISDRVYVVPLDGSSPRRLEGFSEDGLLEGAAVSPSGRFAATAFNYGQGERTLRVWDLETGHLRSFELPESEASRLRGDVRATPPEYARGVWHLRFADEETLFTSGDGGLRRWDLGTGAHELIAATAPGETMAMAMSSGGRTALTTVRSMDDWHACQPAVLIDTSAAASRTLHDFGDCVRWVEIDPTGTVAATGDLEGIVRVGFLDREPHLLTGHEGPIERVAISPDLRWVASSGEDDTLRLWPMPDLNQPPLHTLPHGELIAKLKPLTNIRAVRDPESSTGWSIELDPFPGWEEVPEW